MKPFFLFCFLIVQTSVAIADTVYIRDVIYVPLRGGQSNEHRILHQGLKSGTVLERLEQNDDTGFSRVVTAGGLEGWIQNQYLMSEPIAVERLKTLQTELDAMTADYESARQSLSAEADAASNSAAKIAELENQLLDLNQELRRITELAADVIQIEQQNKQLNGEVDSLNQQIDDLVVVNGTLQDTATQTWYMIGAGTIVVGLLFGLWLGRQMFARRDTGWG